MNWSLVSCGGSFPFSSWNDPQMITLLTFYFFLKLFYHPISFILSEPTINFYFQSTSMFWWEMPQFWASPKIRFILLSLALTWTCSKLTFCCTLTQVLLFPKWLVQLELSSYSFAFFFPPHSCYFLHWNTFSHAFCSSKCNLSFGAQLNTRFFCRAFSDPKSYFPS